MRLFGDQGVWAPGATDRPIFSADLVLESFPVFGLMAELGGPARSCLFSLGISWGFGKGSLVAVIASCPLEEEVL